MSGTGAETRPAALAGHRTALIVATLALCGACAAATLFAFDPATARFYPVCIFHALTGLHCPGCGSLRALHQLLHGHVAAAFGLNALMVLSLPFIAYGLASYGLRWLGRRPLPPVFARPWLGWALFAAIVAFGVLRNIPAWPFSLLAP